MRLLMEGLSPQQTIVILTMITGLLGLFVNVAIAIINGVFLYLSSKAKNEAKNEVAKARNLIDRDELLSVLHDSLMKDPKYCNVLSQRLNGDTGLRTAFEMANKNEDELKLLMLKETIRKTQEVVEILENSPGTIKN
jgi:hypothetical protein